MATEADTNSNAKPNSQDWEKAMRKYQEQVHSQYLDDRKHYLTAGSSQQKLFDTSLLTFSSAAIWGIATLTNGQLNINPLPLVPCPPFSSNPCDSQQGLLPYLACLAAAA